MKTTTPSHDSARLSTVTELTVLGRRGTSAWAAGLLNGANVAPVRVYSTRMGDASSATIHLEDTLKFVSTAGKNKFAKLPKSKRKLLLKHKVETLKLARALSVKSGLEASSAAKEPSEVDTANKAALKSHAE